MCYRHQGSEYLTKHVVIPPHLYGELAKTAKGCGILKQSAHHLELLAVLRDVSQPPLARRTAMWALVPFSRPHTPQRSHRIFSFHPRAQRPAGTHRVVRVRAEAAR